MNSEKTGRRTFRTRRAIVSLFMGFAFICLCGCSEINQHLAGEYSKMQAARTKWESSGITRYQMDWESTNVPKCQFVVQDNQVISVISMQPGDDSTPYETCAELAASERPITVDDLFTYIESQILEPECGPNGCGCDIMLLNAEYDSTWGYPTLVYREQMIDDRPQSGRRWCSQVGLFEPHTEIVNLMPLE